MIDDKSFVLSENNYIKTETIKKMIILGHTGTNKMKHYVKWVNRLNGGYLKTAQYTIDLNGKIYQHFDPLYMSNHLENTQLNKKSIFVLLENEGWLSFDDKKNKYINWLGDIYNKDKPVFEKKWRGYSYWSPYSEEQYISALKLVKQLCEEFYIPKCVVSNNTKIDDILSFNGVIYKSNLEKYYNDLSPAWDFEKFKKDIENE